MKLLVNILDKLVFASGVILFFQVPAFLVQYRHELTGYHAAMMESLSGYQKIADANFNGSLDDLLKGFKAHTDAPVQAVGRELSTSVDNLHRLSKEVGYLDVHDLWQSLWYLARHPRPDLVRSTWSNFSPGIFLSLDALICGIAGGFSLSLLFHLLGWGLGSLFREKSTEKRIYYDLRRY